MWGATHSRGLNKSVEETRGRLLGEQTAIGSLDVQLDLARLAPPRVNVRATPPHDQAPINNTCNSGVEIFSVHSKTPDA